MRVPSMPWSGPSRTSGGRSLGTRLRARHRRRRPTTAGSAPADPAPTVAGDDGPDGRAFTESTDRGTTARPRITSPGSDFSAVLLDEMAKVETLVTVQSARASRLRS